MEYEVLIPEYNRRHLQSSMGADVSLHTIDYMEGNPMQGRMTPRLIGFLSEAEREFFELFCSVDGVGVKKALRAMVRPVREVASAIEDQDHKALSGLPGIGPAMAERIVAKLRRKVPRFALLVAREAPPRAELASTGRRHRDRPPPRLLSSSRQRLPSDRALVSRPGHIRSPREGGPPCIRPLRQHRSSGS